MASVDAERWAPGRHPVFSAHNTCLMLVPGLIRLIGISVARTFGISLSLQSQSSGVLVISFSYVEDVEKEKGQLHSR